MSQKSLFSNTIYKSLLSLFNIVIPILIGPYIVRVLDKNLYSAYNKVYAEFQVFLTFASFGIYTFGVREISKVRDDRKKCAQLFTNLLVISVLTNTITLIIYVLYALFSSSGITTAIYLVMTIQIVGNIFYIEFVNEALENYRFITIKTIIIKLFYFIALLLFVRHPDDILIYSLIVSLTVFFNNIVSFIYAKRRIKFDFSDFHIFSYLKPMFIILIIANVDMLYSQLDRVMLGKFVSDISVTEYYIPYYIVMTVVSVPYSIINVSMPRLSYLLRNDSKEEYVRTLKRSISSLLFIIVPMCAGMFVLSREIIFLYAGDKYGDISGIMMLACVVRLIITIESCFMHLIMYPNNCERQVLVLCASFGFLNLAMNSILLAFDCLTPFNAMLTTGIAEWLFWFAQRLYIRHSLDIRVPLLEGNNKLYFGLSALFVVISFVVHQLTSSMWITIPVIMVLCAGLYAGVLYAVRDPNLMMVLGRVLKR